MTMHSVLFALLLAASAAGQTCPDQVFLPLAEWPDLDPNQIATDPISGEKGLVQVIEGVVGAHVWVVGRVCDRHPVIVTRMRTGQVLELDGDGRFRFQVVSPPDALTIYEEIRITDGYTQRWVTVAIRFAENDLPLVIPEPPEGGHVLGKVLQRLEMIAYKWRGWIRRKVSPPAAFRRSTS